MKILYNKVFLEHDTGMHPENKKRLEACGDLPETDVPSGESYLPLVHEKDYIAGIKKICQTGGHIDADTIVSTGSFEAALRAVGTTLMAAEQNDFALCRPPGHHAHAARASGFCVFNNVAIAAQKLADEGKKVLILDFDGHLGDGTEKFFYESNKVFYWSAHQFPAFPGWGNEDEIGSGEGQGYTINIPLPPASGDDLFWRGVDATMPIIKQFAPDIVAVSAGFDAHHSDLLLDLRLTTPTFYRIGQLLRDEFSNVFATLEGGYNVDYLPLCINNFIDGYNGDTAHHEETPTDSTIQIIDEFEMRLSGLLKNLSKFWNV